VQHVDAKTIIRFLKKIIFSRFSTPRVLISNGGSHFCNIQFKKVLQQYSVKHKVTLPYHPKTNGKVEVSNREVKKNLEKTVAQSRKEWSQKLDEALWAYGTTYKAPIGLTPFQLVHGKSYHLPIELDHKAYWALKFLNFDPNVASEHRKLQLHELEELRFQAYENSKLYMQRVKIYHDKKLPKRVFQPDQRVLLFNPRLRLFPGKLKSKWTGPFIINEVMPHGAMILEDPTTKRTWTVNDNRIKHYLGGDIERLNTLVQFRKPEPQQGRPA